jgi:hypothetical protein
MLMASRLRREDQTTMMTNEEYVEPSEGIENKVQEELQREGQNNEKDEQRNHRLLEDYPFLTHFQG